MSFFSSHFFFNKKVILAAQFSASFLLFFLWFPGPKQSVSTKKLFCLKSRFPKNQPSESKKSHENHGVLRKWLISSQFCGHAQGLFGKKNGRGKTKIEESWHDVCRSANVVAYSHINMFTQIWLLKQIEQTITVYLSFEIISW